MRCALVCILPEVVGLTLQKESLFSNVFLFSPHNVFLPVGKAPGIKIDTIIVRKSFVVVEMRPSLSAWNERFCGRYENDFSISLITYVFFYQCVFVWIPTKRMEYTHSGNPNLLSVLEFVVQV